METQSIILGLAGALAAGLAYAAYTDILRREIANWLNAAIAVAAPVFWWATGLSFWPDIVGQVGLAALVFAVGAGLFAIRAMGGGDVKLLTALALWLPWQPMLILVVLMSLIGGALTILLAGWHLMRGNRHKLKIPYGVAIAAAGMLVIGQRYFNQFA